MRREPAVSIRFALGAGARGPLAILGSAASSCAAAWGLGLLPFDMVPVMGASLAIVLAAVVGGLAGWRAAGSGAVDLRFDGEGWFVHRPVDARGVGRPAETSVRLRVAIDLEDWMLLRCLAVDSDRRADAPAWMAVRRADLEPAWHAFRSAVYSPRSASLPGVAGNPADP